MKFIIQKHALPIGFLLLFYSNLVSQTNWFTLESSLFRIYYSEEDDKSAEELSTLLDIEYADLVSKIGLEINNTVSVFLCPSEEIFNELTGKFVPDWGEGVTDPVRNLIILKSPNLSQNLSRFPKLVLHELTHILVGQSLEHPAAIPRWFNEGIAIYFSHDEEFSIGQAISKALISNSIISLDEIDDVLKFQQEKARLAYEESYSAILFLEEKYGYNRLFQLIQELKKEKNFNQAFLDIFGIDLFEFEWAWNQYVEKKYRWQFLLDFETYLWIFILVLFILVFIAIRFRNRKILNKWQQEERIV
ncbi:MAG: peptidase MA family metallohydrolase [bacterium]